MKVLSVLLTYLLTYLLTPWCRVLLEKLTGFQLVKKFPAFHGTRRFITALTRARHLSLTWASSIQSISPHPTSSRSILIVLLSIIFTKKKIPLSFDERSHLHHLVETFGVCGPPYIDINDHTLASKMQVCLVVSVQSCNNPLTPNDTYSGRTASLNSKVPPYTFIQQI